MKRDPCEIMERIHEYLTVHFKASIDEIAKNQRITWRTAKKYAKFLADLRRKQPISEIRVGKRTIFISTDLRIPGRRYPEELDLASYRAKMTMVLLCLEKALEEHRQPDFVNLIKAQLVSLIDEYNAKLEKRTNFLYPIPTWVESQIYSSKYDQFHELIYTIRHTKFSKIAHEGSGSETKVLTEFMPGHAASATNIQDAFRFVDDEDYMTVREVTRKKEILSRLPSFMASLDPTYYPKWQRIVKLRKRELVFKVEENSELAMVVIGNITVSLDLSGDREPRIKGDRLLLHSFIILRSSASLPGEVAKIIRKILTIVREKYSIGRVVVHDFPGIGSFTINS
jgi:hypothetical protein